MAVSQQDCGLVQYKWRTALETLQSYSAIVHFCGIHSC